MKTSLQSRLATIAPSIAIMTVWDTDPDAYSEWKELSAKGNCMEGESVEDWECWQSEVRATAIVEGRQVEGSAFLGGTWEKRDSKPWASNPDISGYESQMTVEALEGLIKSISITSAGAQDVASQINAAIATIKA